MEASVAAEAGQAENGASPEGEAAAAGLDPAEVMSRFDAMQGSMEEMRSQLTAAQQQALQQQQMGEEPSDEGELDLSWLDPSTPEFDPEDFQQRVGQLIAERSQQAAAPALEAVASMQRQQEAAALRSEFPEIGQPETAQSVIAGASEYAGAVMAHIAPVLQAQGLPPQLIEAIGAGIASSPATWRAVYLGSKGVDAAAAETPAGQGGLLEGGSGPRPGVSQEVDPAQQIVAARGGGVLPF